MSNMLFMHWRRAGLFRAMRKCSIHTPVVRRSVAGKPPSMCPSLQHGNLEVSMEVEHVRAVRNEENKGNHTPVLHAYAPPCPVHNRNAVSLELGWRLPAADN